MYRALRRLAWLPAAGLTAALLWAGAPASANPAESASWGRANLISYTDSDFEGSVGNWVSYSNSTLTDDTSTAFLHNDSLKMTATNSGSQAAKLGTGADAPQISVTGGDTYRVSAWVRAAALSGRTVTFAAGFYTAGGTWLGWTSGTASTLAGSGAWQYVSETITAPATAAYALGSPRITEAGVAAGESMNVDEVIMQPYRAATLIGAEDDSGDAKDWAGANSAIGPIQVDKVFYGPGTALPSSYSDSVCKDIPATSTCLISFKDSASSNNLASFVTSIPAGQNVILTFWQEPENDTFSSCNGVNKGSNGANFVCLFEDEAGIIRGAVTSANAENVFIADDSMDWQYDQGTSHNLGGAGGSCPFIVPSQYTDMYLDDHYEFTASGVSMPDDSGASAEWDGWLGCVQPRDKPIGLAEYGLNCGQTNGVGAEPDALTTSEGMSADSAYLASQPDGLPVVMWEYWWDTNGDSSGNCQFTTGGSPDGTQAVRQWQANETQNGGGAN